MDEIDRAGSASPRTPDFATPRGRGEGSGRGRWRGGEDDGGALGLDDGDGLLALHVALGLTILARVLRRRHTGLPAWAETLSHRERMLAHWTERALLLLLLFAIPLTGVWLVLVSDGALAPHVAAHVAFFIALAAHLGLVLKHQLVDRDRLPRRMV